MQTFSGAKRVGDGPGGLVLLLDARISPAGRILYTYAAAIGRPVTLTLAAGPDTLPPDDPALVCVVQDIQRRMRGRDD